MKKQITKKHPEGFIRINISTDGTSEKNKYFSITADLCEDSTFRNSKIHACGCMHDEILAIMPKLKPFVDIHLSTLDGSPMHSVENGFYWLFGAASIQMPYGPTQSAETCFSYLLNHLRISEQEGNEILGKVVNAYIDGKAELVFEELTRENLTKQRDQGVFKAKNLFSKIVDEQKPRWEKEAKEAIALLETL